LLFGYHKITWRQQGQTQYFPKQNNENGSATVGDSVVKVHQFATGSKNVPKYHAEFQYERYRNRGRENEKS
jgi:hypothetical protein